MPTPTTTTARSPTTTSTATAHRGPHTSTHSSVTPARRAVAGVCSSRARSPTRTRAQTPPRASGVAVAGRLKCAHREKLRWANHTHAHTISVPAGRADRNHRPSDRPSAVAPASEMALGLPTPSAVPRCGLTPRTPRHSP